jgi:hypothetical protein
VSATTTVIDLSCSNNDIGMIAPAAVSQRKVQ